MRPRLKRPWHMGSAVLCTGLGLALGVAADEAALPSCLRQDYSLPQSPDFGHTKPQPYAPDEMACWLDVAQARDGQWMLLDVREGTTPQRAVLPGAAALPLMSLADRRYLREQPLVLVGTGVDLRKLTTACVALRAQGFLRVRVLLGGARSWTRKDGGDLVGPAEFWSGAMDGQWRIVGVGLDGDQVAALPFPPEANLPHTVDGPALRKALNDAERVNPLAPHNQWLVVAADGVQQQAALARSQQAPQEPPIRPLAWLGGGWAAYRAYLNQQQLSAAHAGRALPRVCGS